MPNSPNKLSNFWQELKRRKVVRVITVYAAATFVILELVDILAPNLGLPAWTFNLVLILICVGFIITVIVAWIYDIHPEGGIVKTEPADKVKEEEIPKTSNSWKIASYISFVVIVGLIVLNILPRSSRSEELAILDKSIAVLPFRNDSPDQERMYFINGTMEAILNNLSMIEDLRVPGRTSVEQYRNNPKPISTVAEEMNVSYVLEGSGHRDRNNVRLIVQLLDGKNDRHLWSKTYDAGIEEIFSMQSEIAQLVAEEINAIITPEEIQIIERIPTTNLTAYDFYQRAEDELWKYEYENDRAALDRAENLFYKALEHDSTFAQVYISLADVDWYRNYKKDFFTENFLDSFLILTNIALSYDDQLAEGYRFRGVYYEAIGKPEQALKEYNKALEFNPGWRVYSSREGLGSEDQIQRIKDLQKANSLNQGPQKAISLKYLGGAYLDLGFIEMGMDYYREAFELDRDSFSYFIGLGFAEFSLEDFEKAFEIFRKLAEMNSTWMPAPLIYNLTGHHKELYSLYNKRVLEENGEYSGWGPLVSSHRIGVALWKMGEYEKANSYFNLQVELCNESIKLGRSFVSSRAAYYDLAGAYAWLGEKKKAIHFLKEYNKRQFIPLWWVVQTKIDPLFEPIRDEPEYQQIVKEVEAKYQAEHERVRQWLEDNDML